MGVIPKATAVQYKPRSQAHPTQKSICVQRPRLAEKPSRVYRQRLGKLKAQVGPILGRALETGDRPRALEAARSFLDLVGKSANAWEAIKPWVNHTQRLDLLSQVCLACVVQPLRPAGEPGISVQHLGLIVEQAREIG